MSLLQLESVTLSPAGHTLLRDLDWAVGERERIGLVGASGAGKSTLLRLLAAAIEPEAGRVHRRRGMTVSMLSQDAEVPPGASLLDVALAPPAALAGVVAELERIEARLAEPVVQADAARLARTLARQEEVLERYEALGGSGHEGRVRALLRRLGSDPAVWERPAESASGGQKKIALLASLVATPPDLLLLDEPDNHLDLAAVGQLETLLREVPCSVVLVSHDRYLLDGFADQITELDAARLVHYRGNYSAYVTERELRRLQQRKAWADQQKEIARIEASIRRFEHWARLVVNERHIRQARSRRRALERMEERGEIVERVVEARRMQLELPGHRGSDKALEVTGLGAGFGDEILFLDAELLVRHGERVGLVGPNGSGKSVFLKLALQELEPWEGEIRIGAGTRVGYYAQEHETLGAWHDRTPIELIRDASPMAEDAAVATLLRFLFRYEQCRQPIRVLSGGERSRLQLARLVLQRPNLLLLDEPTNHLDIPSTEVLEQALDDFEGAIVVASHDRYFLDRLVDRVVAVGDGALCSYSGGYTEYLEAIGGTPPVS